MSEPIHKRLNELAVCIGRDPEMYARSITCSEAGQAADLINRLNVDKQQLEETIKDLLSSLVAAKSLLDRGGKKAAPSDRMFDIIMQDYQDSIDRARKVLFG